MSSEYMCPLLNRIINDGYCYDITNAAYGMMKMEALDDKIEREVALKYCDSCEHNQIKDY
ncbi:MAG: hypothetical protein GX754_05320 [Clostridiaceae bacterium]|nr:hypothetical protein [Clostridiaceae bacterium]